jgi:TetR/AcrR family transcriptional regulator, cholesterol catabolism regulator
MPEEQPRRGRPRKGPDPERFQEILDVAAEMFLERGYEATTTQDISEAVGMLKGSLYYYVKSKEDFLFEIIRRTYDQAVAIVEPIATLEGDALTRLRAYVAAHVEFSVTHMTGFSVRQREFRSLSPERQQLITAGGDAYTSVLRRILTDGQDEGLIDPGLDVRIASLGILGMLNSVVDWYRPGGRFSAKRVAEHLSGLVVSSVVSDDVVATSGSLSSLRR